MAEGNPLTAARTVVLVDWPSRDVPDSLARAGLEVVSSEGPAPDDWARYTLEGDEVARSAAGAPPPSADIMYSHRPVEELPEIVELARTLGATTVWCQTGSDEARGIVESAGLAYVDDPEIADAARALTTD